MSLSQWDNADRRGSYRARLQLRLAIVYPQREGRPAQPVYHAMTHDISMSGLSMVVEDNVYHEGEVTVLLALPPVHSWAPQRIISASAVMSYAIRSSKLNAFKIGMSFVEIKADGKALLRSALSQGLGKTAEGGRRQRSACSETTGWPGDNWPSGR